MTSYAEIFNLALSEITDPALAKWSEKDLSDELYKWLQKAIGKLPQIRDEVTERDSFDHTKIDKIGFVNTLSDTTKTVLALAIVREWLNPQIASTLNTWQRFSKKEGYSQAEHLKQLMALDEKYKIEIKKLLRDDTYVDNDYFD